MNEKKSLVLTMIVSWAGVFFFAALAAAAVHTGYHVPIRQLLIPVVVLSIIQGVTLTIVYWTNKKFRSKNDLRPSLVVVGAYLIVVILTAMHFGVELRLIQPQVFRSDGTGISIGVFVITVLSVVILSRRSSRLH